MRREGNLFDMRKRRGSVLMEFVIVAPLYFLLLGGMFYVGEFLLNRIRINVGDNFLTWSVATRLKPAEMPITGYLEDWLFSETLEKARLTVDLSSNSSEVNQFCGLFMGGIDRVEVGIPAWATGMLTMHKILSGQSLSEDDTAGRFAYFDEAESNIRVVCLHRFNDSDAAPGYSRSKNIPARDLLPQNNLANVISDGWINSDVQEKHLGTQGTEHGGDIVRRMISWGE